MELSLTADERLWPDTGKVLFLGTWCKLYSRKEHWEKINHEVLPYHWDDREKLHEDYLYCQSVYKEILPQVAFSLNSLLATSHSLKFWDDLLGFTLLYITEISYDRYLSIKNASLKASHCYIRDYNWGEKTAGNTLNLLAEIPTDAFNDFIYARLVEFLKPFPYEKKRLTDPLPQEPGKFFKFLKKVKNKIQGISSPSDVMHLLRYVLRDHGVPEDCDIACFSSYLSESEEQQLFARMKKVFLAPRKDIANNYIFNSKMREQFTGLLAKAKKQDEFSAFLLTMIAECLPAIYLEGFHDFLERVEAVSPQRCRLIFTSIGHEASEHLKFYLAWQREANKTKLVINQHGGTYGIAKWSSFYDFETARCDSYACWGYSDPHKLNLTPLPALKLADLDLMPDWQGDITWVLGCSPRYSYRLFAFHIGPQFANYLDEQLRFYAELDDSTKSKTQAKVYSQHYGWECQKRLQDAFANIRLSPPNLKVALRRSRLVVTTYNGTTFLESLSCNFPTVIFFDPQFSEFSQEAEELFSKLEDLKIFHRSAESAARHINAIADDVQSWWFNEELQHFRQQFCSYYASKDPAWVRIWQEYLQEKNEAVETAPDPSFV